MASTAHRLRARFHEALGYYFPLIVIMTLALWLLDAWIWR